MTIQDLLKTARTAEASDLILVAGKPPYIYVHGQWTPLGEQNLMPPDLDALLAPFMNPLQRQALETTGDTDFSCGIPGLGRARVNIHRQRASLAAAIRFINTTIPSFEQLGLPGRLAELATLPRGLVLVTGATGSGKSTTLAAMIEYINEHFSKHIITLEDPIEFLFTHRNCVIEQREIGDDSPSFASALKHVLRQKPDVILVGEMRDKETIATALTASETGHLVLGTLHTNSAAQTIERIIDVFEAAHQPQIRTQLANTLQAVLCQSLVKRRDARGMVPAIELMCMTPGIRRAIRDGETHLIPGMIETGQKLGMCTLDKSLADLANAGKISKEDALAKAVDAERLTRMIGMGGNSVAFDTGGKPAAAPEPVLAGPPAASKKPWL